MCATLVDEWVAAGVRHGVIAPGSRSTPMALALLRHEAIDVEVVIDERSAAFVALGLGLDGRPAILLCTSGTAAVNFHPAIVEADLSEVPMIVVTADRPPELRGVGAPQTIDQVELYGRSVRWFVDVAPAEDSDPSTWRPLARRSHRAATSGPVHLNLAFREPLLGQPGPIPAPIDELPDTGTSSATESPRRDRVPDAVDTGRGVIIAGGRSGVAVESIEQLAEATRWPILADPTSPARGLAGAVTAADPILRHGGFAGAHRPEVAIRIGRPPASRIVAEWLTWARCPIVQVGGPGVIDPEGLVVARCSIDDLVGRSWTSAATPWAARWQHAERRAQEALAEVWRLETHLSEPYTARLVAEHCGDRDVVVASSMPIRDLEWYGGAAARAHANRGANGIDGTLSTALGRALTGRPVTVLVGDLAFVHDSNALIGIDRRRDIDLQIVVVDNDGGGIFSFLAQGTDLDEDSFETLFGTPHRTDLMALATAYSVPAITVDTAEDLVTALRRRRGEPEVIRVVSDRRTNRDDHRRLNEAVARALDDRP